MLHYPLFLNDRVIPTVETGIFTYFYSNYYLD
jgi:hypothetical protein